MPLSLLFRGVALDREQLPAGTKERKAPAGELVERRHRSADYRVYPPDTLADDTFLRPAPDDLYAQIQLGDDVIEKCDSAQHWLDENHGQIGPCQRQRYPGQAGTAPDVGEANVGGNQLGHRRTVEKVPIPYSFCLAGADQSPIDARGGKQLGVPNRGLESATEDLRGGGWRRGRIGMFHVKHSPAPPNEPCGCETTRL
jgi:hypothetical protein